MIRHGDMRFPNVWGPDGAVTGHSEAAQEAAEAYADATDTFVDPVTLRRHKRPYATGRPDLALPDAPSLRERREQRAAQRDEQTARANTRPTSSALGDVLPMRRTSFTTTNESSPGVGPEAA